MQKNLLSIVLFFIFLLPVEIFASIIINEIAWMETNTSYNDEWIVTTTEPFLYSQALT